MKHLSLKAENHILIWVDQGLAALVAPMRRLLRSEKKKRPTCCFCGRPLSRETLIEDVWGYPSDVGSYRTVDAHMRHLRQKLEDNPANPRWLVTVRGIGYKFEP